MSTPTPDSFKEKASALRKFLNEKCNVEISQGHSLEAISKMFGFKDWNTASAISRSEFKARALPDHIKNVGQMKKVLEPLEDSMKLEVGHDFLLKPFLEAMAEFSFNEGTVIRESSLVLVEAGNGVANFRLKIEDERIGFVDDYRDCNGNPLNWD